MMGKTIERGMLNEGDPGYSNGWTIGPVQVCRPDKFGSEPQRQENRQLGTSKESQEDEIARTVVLKSIEYGCSNDESQIPLLFALYREWIGRSSAETRLQALQVLTAAIEERCGCAILALMPFITAEAESHIISTAALNLCVLYPVEEDPLAGPRFLASVLEQNPTPDGTAGAALGGMMLLGDERLSSLIRQIWEKWPPEARKEAVRQHSPFVSKSYVELLLEFLATESELATYGCIAAALANAAVRAERNVGVSEVERVFPAWSAPDEPLKIKRHWSRQEFAAEIQNRLEQLIATELTGPNEEMIMPIVLRRWLGDFS
jgi:hypothetical protein